MDVALLRPSTEISTRHDYSYESPARSPYNTGNDPPGNRSEVNSPCPSDDDPCPYYYDAKLELKMYRGPGFKQFHPVLGSMAGHQEICDEWDARQLKRRHGSGQANIIFRSRTGIRDADFASANAANNQNGGTTTPSDRSSCQLDRKQEQHCLEEVLLVFPQVQHDFVRRLFRERHSGNTGMLVESRTADSHTEAAIIAAIAEMESFPLQKDLKRKHSPITQENEDVTVRWNKDIQKNEAYYKEALILLAENFNRVPTHFIHRTLREKGNLYDAFHLLAEYENTSNDCSRKPYIRTKLARRVLEKKYQRNSEREAHQYISIVNELQAARQQQHRQEVRRKRQKADEEAEAQNFKLHQLQGSLVDCQCCFNEAPLNRMTHCENDDTHFFCNKCIELRASELIGAQKYELSCMDTSGCGSELSKEALARALPTKVFDKLAEIQQLAEIKAAGLDGLEQCPFCEYQAVCPPVDTHTIFECLNPDCEKASCRKCNGESHVPISCEEAKKDRGLSARHAVEEARSEAMMRTCPRCKVKIVKSAGCNKIVCSSCRAVSCYVCRKDITGKNYEHFGTGSTRCPIQDQSPEDRHQQEADNAEKAAIAAAKAQDADINEEDLRIEAHLNKGPSREQEIPGRLGIHAALHLPALPQFHLMGIPQHHLLVGDQGAGLIAEHEMNNFQQLLQQAHHQQRRVREMLEIQQQHLRRLQPFLPTPMVAPMPNPPRADRVVVPHIRQAEQYLQYAYPRPAVGAAPTQAPLNALNGEANVELADRAQDVFRQDLRYTDRRHHNHHFQRVGDDFPAYHQTPLLQDDLRNLPLWAQQPNDGPNLPDLGPTQGQEQPNQA